MKAGIPKAARKDCASVGIGSGGGSGGRIWTGGSGGGISTGGADGTGSGAGSTMGGAGGGDSDATSWEGICGTACGIGSVAQAASRSSAPTSKGPRALALANWPGDP